MKRIRILFIIILLGFGGIIVRLFDIQILSAQKYTNGYLKTRKIQPIRGKIYDRNGLPLAVNQTNYQLFAEPKLVTDKDDLVKKLDGILQIGEVTLSARLDMSKVWVALKNNVDEKTKTDIERLGEKGLGFDSSQRRFYPEASLSAHVLGFVGKNDTGDDVGYFGIEGYFDRDLAGLPGILKSDRDAIGRPIFMGTQKRMREQNGRDLLLTIDSSVQRIVKDKLKAGMDAYEARQGCVIVADPMTMDIFSLVCLPDFDPDKYFMFDDDVMRNHALSDTYEPGSTFKPLVVASAIEEGAVKPDEIIPEAGPISMGTYTIRTWDNKYSGSASVMRVLEKSSNVGMVYIGGQLGNEKLVEYIEKYGFGTATGIELQGEVNAPLRPHGKWYPIDYATATFGQGIAVTPIQLIRGFSAVINGGNLLKPAIVYSYDDERTKTKRAPKVERRVISEKTSEIMRKMLISTVENGDARWARPKGYILGGKTGTAQIAVDGTYDVSKTIASFVGFGPAENPRFIALVVLWEPKSSIWGSETAAPIFFNIAKELLVYLNVAPE